MLQETSKAFSKIFTTSHVPAEAVNVNPIPGGRTYLESAFRADPPPWSHHD